MSHTDICGYLHSIIPSSQIIIGQYRYINVSDVCSIRVCVSIS